MAESRSPVRLDRGILPSAGACRRGTTRGFARAEKLVKGPHCEDDYRTKTLQGVGALDSIGEALRAAREAQGHTIQDVSLATRIRASYVEALESEDFAELGGDVYAKGFLRSYAAFLGLDPEPLVETYRERYATDTSPVARLQSMRDSGVLGAKEPRRRGWRPLGIGCVVIVLVLGVWSLVAGRAEPTSAPTVAAPETTLPPTTTLLTTTSSTTTIPLDEVNVLLKFDSRSWASVTVDGKRAFRGILSKGEERSFTGERAIDVALGNAGAVLLTVNGTELGYAGRYGQAFQRTYTVDQQPASGEEGTGQASQSEGRRQRDGRRRLRDSTGTRTSTSTSRSSNAGDPDAGDRVDDRGADDTDDSLDDTGDGTGDGDVTSSTGARRRD